MVFEIFRASLDWDEATKPSANSRPNEHYSPDLSNGKWVIEINSLDDLMQLIDEVEMLIVDKDSSILIYDDYVE